MRERIGLDGNWRFWPDLNEELVDSSFVSTAERNSVLGAPRAIAVPGCWQAQFDDLRLWAGMAWYERSFDIPSRWDGRLVRLCFGAVDYFCTVWINGELAGEHEGGYLPFSFDVSGALIAGATNLVTVKVLDVGPNGPASSPYPFDELPHGKQSWYGPIGGLWQSVHLEATAHDFIERIAVHGDPATGVARVQTSLWRKDFDGRLSCTISSPDGHDTYHASAAVDPEGNGFDIDVPSAQVWDVDSPHLYTVEVQLHDDRARVDAAADTFGFRSIAAEDGALLLNGRPLYLLGALDQDYYLGSIYTPPSDNLLREQVLKAKELGLNLLRCHIKVPDPRYLYWADRLGLLVWTELPNWNTLTEDAKRRGRQTLAGLIERDFNHPSIIIWTVINEGWGVDIPNEKEHRQWIGETYRWAKALDPTRLVIDNSACPPNFHVESDINDYHLYKAMPDHQGEWVAWTSAWAAHPDTTYSLDGDALRHGGEPMVLSEFGNWGLPDNANLVDERGEYPWWFDTGREHTGGIVEPRDVEDRWLEWGMDEVFGSYKEFVAQSQDAQFDAMKFEIEDMRSHQAIVGYVITEFTDLHWECNGLLDMARMPKAYHHRLREISALDVTFALCPPVHRLRSGEHFRTEVMVSHYSQADLDDCRVRWAIPDFVLDGALDGPHSFPAGRVARLGSVDFGAPPLGAPVRVPFHLWLEDRWGRTINQNSHELLLWPEHSAPGSARLWTGGPIEPALEEIGWSIEHDPDAADITVTDKWDDDVAAWVRTGGRALMLADGEDALPEGLSLKVQGRAGSMWEGDWAQGMGWLRPALTEGLSLRPRMDFSFSGLTPEEVVTGYAPADNRDVLAGFYVGWVRSTVATVGAFSHGSGAGIVCTLPLATAYGADPLATELTHRLIQLLGAPDFAPAKRL
ncbi:MAG: glycoside hydrolase family 2 [Actinomycetota bacterium]|nr:glycoside hydrolase family 2 [Actinomycetota bacterium]